MQIERVPVESDSSLNMISIAETIAQCLNKSVLKNIHSLHVIYGMQQYTIFTISKYRETSKRLDTSEDVAHSL